MMPDAPVRFSTMNCCLSESVSLAARSRASGSTEPPGGYGDTNLTTRVGHSCAWTGNASSASNRNLKSDIPSSLQFEHLARIVGRRDGKPQLLQYAARLRHLIGIGPRERAA